MAAAAFARSLRATGVYHNGQLQRGDLEEDDTEVIDDWSSDYPHSPVVRQHHTHLRKDGPSLPWEGVTDRSLGLESEEEEEEEEEEYNDLPAPRSTLQIEDVSDLPNEDLFTMNRERSIQPSQVEWETPSGSFVSQGGSEVPIRRAGILPPVRPALLPPSTAAFEMARPTDVNDIDYHRVVKAQFTPTPNYYHRRRLSTHQANTEQKNPTGAMAPRRRLSRNTATAS